MGWHGLDSSGSGQEKVASCYEHGGKPGSIKCWEFLTV